MSDRRAFLGTVLGGTAALTWHASREAWADTQPAANSLLRDVKPGEDLFQFIKRQQGAFDQGLYKFILGAGNEFKEGDEIVGIAAKSEQMRADARRLIRQTRLEQIDAHPVLSDELHRFSQGAVDVRAVRKSSQWTLGQLKDFLLRESQESIKAVMPGLSSQVIGCVVKLMSNEELIAVGAKVFNTLPGSMIGAKGYLGARVQPNSPTDNLDDIRWQVFDAWSYGVGDVLLGTNPVSSEPDSVAEIEQALGEIIAVFELEDVLPHCVLSHIDVQAEVEQSLPGSTALWFQSIAGTDNANATFGISVEKMVQRAEHQTGRYGLYFETGQGADFTNGHGGGFDMVLHESRKYGFARALTARMAKAASRRGSRFRPWVHLNDVAGFIGPEVFRTREQLVRCCLEDIVMGKLHGLCIGLDVCSTLHMDVSLDDLDWCIDQIMPANPAYLMALPTKIDPMLGYLTTGFQDHVRIREKFGYKVNDRMWRFFMKLGVIDREGNPTKHFGDPLWVFTQYQRRKGDERKEAEIRADGEAQLAAVAGRGVFVARGYGRRASELTLELKTQIDRIYEDAKKSIWSELSSEFISTVPRVRQLKTRSSDRKEYILHPESGERLAAGSRRSLNRLRDEYAGKYDVQLVVSDGLNALAISDPGQLMPYLEHVRTELVRAGYRVAPEHVLLTAGRVRAGYRIGEALFGGLSGLRAILHVIGERPGTGHHTFSIYLTKTSGEVWKEPGRVDHDITKVVSGVATTALSPQAAAVATVRILGDADS